jgi:hypothetical protein
MRMCGVGVDRKVGPYNNKDAEGGEFSTQQQSE